MGEAPVERWSRGPGLVASMGRYWLGIVLATAALGLLAAAAEARQAPLYEVEAQLLVGPMPRTQFETPLTPEWLLEQERLTLNAVHRLGSQAVRDRAADLMGDGTTADDLRPLIQIIVDDGESDAVRIVGRAGDPQVAVTIVEATIEGYRQLVLDEARVIAERQIEQLENAIGRAESRLQSLPSEGGAASVVVRRDASLYDLLDLEGRLEEVRREADNLDAGVEELQIPEAPQDPIRPRPAFTGLLGAFVGFVGATLYAYRREAP